MVEFKDGCHHQVESEWMSEVFLVQMVGGKCEWRFFCANGGNQSWQVWVSLRRKTKVAESKMVKFKIAEFKMASIIKLSQNEWVRVELNKFESEFFLQNGCIEDGRIQDGSHHQVNQIELVWFQSGGRMFLSESERRKEGVWIQHGRIQDGCHHQVESEWMSEGFIVQMVGTNLDK